MRIGFLPVLMALPVGCAAPMHVAAPDLTPLSDERVRDAASRWMFQEQGVTIDERVTWGPTSRDEDGRVRVVAWVAGDLADGGEGVRRYVMDVVPSTRGGPHDEANVIRAWGPREVGSGCTCHYFGEARLK